MIEQTAEEGSDKYNPLQQAGREGDSKSGVDIVNDNNKVSVQHYRSSGKGLGWSAVEAREGRALSGRNFKAIRSGLEGLFELPRRGGEGSETKRIPKPN